MKISSFKRVLMIILVLAVMFSVYSPSAFCASPSPSPTGTATASPSPTPTETATSTASITPTDTAGASPTASGTVGFQILGINSKGSGVIRVQMRLRELGYFNLRATGNYFNNTKKAVMDFQKNNKLGSDGSVGENTYSKLFSTTGIIRQPLSPSVTVVHGKGLTGTPKTIGTSGDWATVINTAFPVGMTVKVTDFNDNSISFNMTRTGGTNLAEVEVAMAADYTAFKNCFGGQPNWEKRAVLVTINGTNYAASLFGNPNGADTLPDNGMNGHTTLYFSGSTSDVSGFVDKEDNDMALTAAGQ